MQPARTVPLLHLDSMNSPSQIIKNYLGVELNSNDRYLSVYSNEAICHIWSRRIREREEASLQNSCQVLIFKKAVSLLKEKKPLNPLSDLSVCYAPPKENCKMDNIENRAELIVAIFHSRFSKDLHFERYHRKNLAFALKWHMKEYFRNESQDHIKGSTSCPTVFEEVKLSPSGRILKSTSQNAVPRILPWTLGPSKKDLICEISMECLSYCRAFWLGNSPDFISEAGEKEYVQLQQSGFLLEPQMGLLLERELAKDIAFSFSGENLALDIGRNISHISVSNACTQSTFSKNTKKISENDAEKLNSQSCRFQNFLTNLMLGLKTGFNKREELQAKWNWHVEKERSELSNDSFTFAVKGFFNQELNSLDREENKLMQLLILLRQRMYMHPLLVIREVLKDIPLYFKPDDPSRLMACNFLESRFEYQLSYIAELSYEDLKSSKKNKLYPPFQMKLLNTMRASLENLSSWSSEITIEISPLPGKKKGSLSNESLEQKVLGPLQKLGFNVNLKI